MAKPIKVEDMGEAGVSQIQGPQSFQLNGHGTPAHPCDMIPEMDATPDLYEIPDPLGLSKGGNKMTKGKD